MRKRKEIDYARLEADWRAGIKSTRQMAAEYEEATGVSVSHVSIKNYFDSREIPRDLNAKVQAKAEAIVLQKQLNAEANKLTPVKEREIVEANASLVADVRLAHRGDIRRARELAAKLLGELDAETDGLEHLIRLGEMMFDPDEKTGRDRLNEIYQKVISTPGRVDAMKKLSETLRNLVGLEREAYGMKSDEADQQGLRAVPVTALDERL